MTVARNELLKKTRCGHMRQEAFVSTHVLIHVYYCTAHCGECGACANCQLPMAHVGVLSFNPSALTDWPAIF